MHCYSLKHNEHELYIKARNKTTYFIRYYFSCNVMNYASNNIKSCLVVPEIDSILCLSKHTVHTGILFSLKTETCISFSICNSGVFMPLYSDEVQVIF